VNGERPARQRLFVGLAVPADLAARLVALQPRPGPGIRLVVPAQMHLTLHFLGQADPIAVRAALTAVDARGFGLAVEGTGSFRLRNGGRIVWAGVATPPALLELHTATARALAALGFEPERRAYRPHITLARCKPDAAVAFDLPADSRDDAPAGAARAAAGQAPEPQQLGSFTADAFVLYRSDNEPGGPRYTAIERFALRRA
jgi:2'-5' RNA ligase